VKTPRASGGGCDRKKRKKKGNRPVEKIKKEGILKFVSMDEGRNLSAKNESEQKENEKL